LTYNRPWAHLAASLRVLHLAKDSLGKMRADDSVEGPLPSGFAYGPLCEEMGTRAISGLTIGLCVAFLAILSALHALEPEFNPPHLISEYQLAASAG
jgi:hypothetical protein